MLADPLVSVLLPVWNGERFLAAAIGSITSQTYGAFELIVVDDGSTDDSASIAGAVASRDSRVTVLSRPHGGLVAALNAGLAAARGEYLARIDADDCAAPTRLAQQVAHLDAHRACVVVGSVVDVIDDAGASLGVLPVPSGHAAILDALLAGRTGLAHPSVMMRRAAVVAVGGYRADAFPCEDLDLWLRLRARGEFANLQTPLLRYRRHPGAIGIRQRGAQVRMTRALAAAARADGGRPGGVRWPLPAADKVDAAYHFECARIALRSGQRTTAWRHARAAAASSPWWPLPYAVLAACGLPAWTVPLLTRVYTRFATV